MGAAAKRMTADAFLAWAEGRDGRWELIAGAQVAMAPERAQHVAVKIDAANALRRAFHGTGCRAIGDGMSVVIDEWTAYVPDAAVQCGKAVGRGDVVLSAPLLVVEVLSPSNSAAEMAAKLRGYFRVPTLRHVLVIDPDAQSVAHHRRREDGAIETWFHEDGAIALEPPGAALPVDALFERLREDFPPEPEAEA